MSEVLLENVDESYLSLKDWQDQHGVIAGITTRCGGVSKEPYHHLNVGFHVGDNKEDVLTNRKIVANKLSIPLERWVVAEQPHRTEIFKVDEKDAGKGAADIDTVIKGMDGLYTNIPGLLLVSMHADCVPLYFLSKKNNLVGVAHAGWKGTVGNIGKKMIERWQEEGVALDEIQIAIGPSIGQCCYEVDDFVIDQVKKLQLENSVSFKKTNGKFMLNLKLLNKLLLLKAGISEHSISISEQCTSCSTSVYFSHRKESGKTGRMMAYIGISNNGMK